MKQNNQWLKYLDIYGCDITRWPVTPNSNDIKKIMSMPEFQSLSEMESILFQVQWPTPASHLKTSTMAAIHQKTLADVLIIEEHSRQGFWLQLACFVLCLGIGLSIGHYYTDQYNEQSDYHYFSVGPAYSY